MPAERRLQIEVPPGAVPSSGSRTLTWTSACKRTREVSETAVQDNRKIPAEFEDVWRTHVDMSQQGGDHLQCHPDIGTGSEMLKPSESEYKSVYSHVWMSSTRRTRRLCWSTEKCTCRVYCRRSRHDGAATRSRKGVGVYSTLTSCSPPVSSMLTKTTTKSWRSDTLIILP